MTSAMRVGDYFFFGLTAALRPAPAENFGAFEALIFTRLARARVDALAGCPFHDRELAEACDRHLVAFFQRLADRVDERLDRARGVGFRQAAVCCDRLDQLGLVHTGTSFHLEWVHLHAHRTASAEATAPASSLGSAGDLGSNASLICSCSSTRPRGPLGLQPSALDHPMPCSPAIDPPRATTSAHELLPAPPPLRRSSASLSGSTSGSRGRSRRRRAPRRRSEDRARRRSPRSGAARRRGARAGRRRPRRPCRRGAAVTTPLIPSRQRHSALGGRVAVPRWRTGERRAQLPRCGGDVLRAVPSSSTISANARTGREARRDRSGRQRSERLPSRKSSTEGRSPAARMPGIASQPACRGSGMKITSAEGALGRGQQAQLDGRDHAERPLGADQQALQVIARDVLARPAADLHELAGREHDLQARDPAAGHAVLEGVRAAGVRRDVAADLRLLGRAGVGGEHAGRSRAPAAARRAVLTPASGQHPPEAGRRVRGPRRAARASTRCRPRSAPLRRRARCPPPRADERHVVLVAPRQHAPRPPRRCRAARRPRPGRRARAAA